MDLINECTFPGKLILLSGDEDMHPLVQRAHDRKWLVEVWSWKDSIKNEYAQSSDIDIVRFLDDLKYDFVFHKAEDLEYNYETYREYCASEKEKNQKFIFDNVAAVGLAERGLSVLKSLKNRK